MEEQNKRHIFSSKVTNMGIEKMNPLFSKVKIYVMYAGLNRNGFYLSKEAVNRAIPTLFNTPIVGQFLTEEKNFSGHGVNIVKDENGNYKEVLSTRPYGLIPESAQVYWEMVTDEHGIEKEYLVVDGAYLWTGRYPELNTIHDEGYYGQSMEIEVSQVKPVEVNGVRYLDAEDFIFTGFCLLGIDKDSDMFGHVEPAFNQAKVVAYSLDKDTFKSQFNQMIDELKFTLQEGDKIQMEAQDELKKRLDNPTITEVVEVEETPVDETPVAKDETENETSDAIQEAIDVATQEVTEPSLEAETGEPEQDLGETETEVTDPTEAPTEGGTDGGDGVADGGTTFTVSQEDFDALQAKFSTLEAENQGLRQYKRSRELGDLKAQFTNQATEQELTAVFNDNQDSTIEELELKIFALIGKKNFSLTSTKEKNRVSLVSPKTASDEAVSPYGDIFK